MEAVASFPTIMLLRDAALEHIIEFRLTCCVRRVSGDSQMQIAALVRAAICAALSLIVFPAAAADYPTPQEGDWVALDFRFHSGEVMHELHLHYTTVGAPSGQPVLILHGTTQPGTAILSPVLAGELFGPGQPLDASKYGVVTFGPCRALPLARIIHDNQNQLRRLPLPSS